MSKLNTNAIKKLITMWLATPEVQQDIRTYYFYENFSQEDLINFVKNDERYGSDRIGIKTTDTIEQAQDKIAKAFCNPNRWKRVEKRKLKDEWEDHFQGPDNQYSPRAKPEYNWDWHGGCDEALVAEIYTDKKALENCIIRTFIPDGYMEDNFRLEVITDPTDSKVVGWGITVD